MSKPILCVDFDGVIHSYTSGWKGANTITDPPVPGAIQWLLKAQDLFTVMIYSSRSSQEGGIEAMYDYIRAFAIHELNPDRVEQVIANLQFPSQKPAAFLTIDDRALQFKGNWDEFDPMALLQFKPWNK